MRLRRMKKKGKKGERRLACIRKQGFISASTRSVYKQDQARTGRTCKMSQRNWTTKRKRSHIASYAKTADTRVQPAGATAALFFYKGRKESCLFRTAAAPSSQSAFEPFLSIFFLPSHLVRPNTMSLSLWRLLGILGILGKQHHHHHHHI